jgi:hypothetical protein
LRSLSASHVVVLYVQKGELIQRQGEHGLGASAVEVAGGESVGPAVQAVPLAPLGATNPEAESAAGKLKPKHSHKRKKKNKSGRK